MIDDLYRDRVIDNRKVKMVDALRHFISKSEVHSISIAVGYFYLSGLLLIKDEFIEFMNKRSGQVKIIMGNETNNITSRLLTNNPGEDYIQKVSDLLLEDADTIEDADFLLMVKQWLQEKRIEVKVYTGEANYFHAKSYLFYDQQDAREGKAIVGSSNFSKNGLEGNTELNVLSQDNFYALKNWFDTLWKSEEVSLFSPDLLNIVNIHIPESAKGKPYKPVRETYYDFSRLYSHSYSELNNNDEWVKLLYAHQQSGIIEVEDRLLTYGTAVLSDGVGLGKTRTAAGIMKLAQEVKINKKALIVADKKLHIQWSEELAILGVNQTNFDFINRETFSKLKKIDLDLYSQKYNLVIIDEAHLGFKNSGTKAYQRMRYIFEKSKNTIQGLLLTATPWNNKREDVINLGCLFLNIDKIPSDRSYKKYLLYGINNKTISKLSDDTEAFSEFWQDLYLQRTRKTYGGSGNLFAKREFPTIKIKYEPRKEKLFADNFDKISELYFPYMDPIRFVVEDRSQLTSDRLKLLLLKRADSSWISYVKSLEKIRNNTNELLSKLELIMTGGLSSTLSSFKIFLAQTYKLDEYEQGLGIFWNSGLEVDEDSNAELLEMERISKSNKERYLNKITKQIDTITGVQAKKAIQTMKSQAELDLVIVNGLIDELNRAYNNIDEKYLKIYEEILKERTEGKKVILISQFKDTAVYYYNLLNNEILINSETIGLVTGDPNETKINNEIKTKNEVLDRFSPKSKKVEGIEGSKKEIHLLIGTDTISTGQNLQDATVLMNLDLPYNPMILEQRIGRIDRPRDDYSESNIWIYTFPVYEAIEAELKMTERLQQKMDGVLKDTEFDSVVLPTYMDYLKESQNSDKSVSIVKSIIDNLDSKQIGNSSGMNSDTHSAAYKEANKRMYDTSIVGIHRIDDTLFDKYSFSNGALGNSISVIQIKYKDSNKAILKTENKIINLSLNRECSISEAESYLYGEIGYSISSEGKYPKDLAQKKIDEANKILKENIPMWVEEYNSRIEEQDSSMSYLSDPVSESAATKIKESTIDPLNSKMIESKLKTAGFEKKEIGKIFNAIKVVTPESELYQIVVEIDADVNQFWLNFDSYAEIFREEHAIIERAKDVVSIDRRLASSQNSMIEVLLSNIVIDN